MQPAITHFLVQWRFSAPVTAVCILGFMLALIVLSGAYKPSSMPYYFGSEREYIGMLLLMSLMPAYVALSAIWSLRRTIDLTKIIDTNYETKLTDQVLRVSPFHLFVAAALGLAYAMLFNIPGNGLNFFKVQPSEKLTIFGQATIWMMIAFFLYLRIHASMAFRRAGSGIPVDIFETSNLRPFAQLGLIDVLVVAGGLVLSTVQSLDFSFRFDNYSKALIVLIPAVAFLMINPMWLLHQRMTALKEEELRQLNNIIANTSKELEIQKMESLEILLQRRERASDLATWPIDLSVLQRFLFYIIIPPSAWVGAAIVEYLVESAITQ